MADAREGGQLTPLEAARKEEFRRFNTEFIDAVKARGVRIMVGGGYAVEHYTGIVRANHKDMDVFCLESERDGLLEIAESIGHASEIVYPDWLSKIKAKGQEDVFIDIIHQTGNGLSVITEDWYRRAQPAVVLGKEVLLPPVEELLHMMSPILNWDRSYIADIQKILLAQSENIDWRHMIDIFGENSPILLAQLILFRHGFPSNTVPKWVYEELMQLESQGLENHPQDTNISRARIYSPTEFETIFQQGQHIPTHGRIWKRK